MVSIPNKRDRYEALANRFAELSGGTENVTAVVIGRREQAQLTAWYVRRCRTQGSWAAMAWR